MKAFVVHPHALVKKGRDAEDREALALRGFTVVATNQEPLESELFNAESQGDWVRILTKAIAECDLLIFRTYDDGRIPKTIADKAKIAAKLGKIVLELPNVPLPMDRLLSPHATAIRDETVPR